jgi:serine/threonine protein kinase
VLSIHTLPHLLSLTVITLCTWIPSTIICPLDPIHQLRIVKELSEAVAFLHQGGIVHRDIRPKNVSGLRSSDEEKPLSYEVQIFIHIVLQSCLCLSRRDQYVRPILYLYLYCSFDR